MCCYTFLKITICPSIYLMEVNWINYDANQLDFRIILAVFCLFTQWNLFQILSPQFFMHHYYCYYYRFIDLCCKGRFTEKLRKISYLMVYFLNGSKGRSWADTKQGASLGLPDGCKIRRLEDILCCFHRLCAVSWMGSRTAGTHVGSPCLKPLE